MKLSLSLRQSDTGKTKPCLKLGKTEVKVVSSRDSVVCLSSSSFEDRNTEEEHFLLVIASPTFHIRSVALSTTRGIENGIRNSPKKSETFTRDIINTIIII